jgi:hypothetical protein
VRVEVEERLNLRILAFGGLVQRVCAIGVVPQDSEDKERQVEEQRAFGGLAERRRHSNVQ